MEVLFFGHWEMEIYLGFGIFKFPIPQAEVCTVFKFRNLHSEFRI